MEPPRGPCVLLYLSVTVAPAPSRAAFAFSAASLVAFSRTGLGAPSTSAFASPRPRLVSVRTSLMTWIFFSPAASRMTSNSSCSSTASAVAAPPGAPGAARTAAGAAAVTSNVSSNCFTKSESSSSVISLNVSSSSSVLSFAMVGVLSDSPVEPAGWWLLRRLGGSFCGAGSRGSRRQRLEYSGDPGQQYLARLEIGDPVDLVGAERSAVEDAALDHQQRVGLGEVAQTLGGFDRVAADERDRGRADEQGLVDGDSGV